MLLTIVGIVLIVFALADIWRRGYGPPGGSELAAPGGWSFKTVFPPLLILGLGVALLVASRVHIPGSDRNPVATTPSAPKDSRARPPGDTATPTATTTTPATSLEPVPPTSTSSSPSTTATPGSTDGSGPWEDRKEDVHLVVEKIRPGRGVGARLVVHMRIENDSVYDLTSAENSFLAVDSLGQSYGADWENSNWRPTPREYDEQELPHGRTIRGYILLDDRIPRGANALDVRYTLSYGYGKNSVTVHATVPLVSGRRSPRPSST